MMACVSSYLCKYDWSCRAVLQSQALRRVHLGTYLCCCLKAFAA
jgi:hypothetical protein